MQTELMKKLELRLLDFRYIARERFSLQAVPVHADIALILVDEDTLDRIEEPESLWFPLYARILAGLDQAGVKAVGIDAVISYLDLEKFAAVGPALLGIKDRLVFIAYLNQDGRTGQARLVLPNKVLLALGQQNVGLANPHPRPGRRSPRPGPLPGVTRPGGLQGLEPLHSAPGRDLLGPHPRSAAGAPSGTSPFRSWLRTIPASSSTTWAPPARAFPRYSFAEVLKLAEKGDQAELKRRFAGKIVLIGPGSKASQDITETPFSALAAPVVTKGLTQSATGSSVLGIYVQASVLNTLLTGSWLRKASPTLDRVILFTFCVLVALVVYRLGALGGVVFSLAVGLLVGIGSVLAFSKAGLWIDTTSLLVAIPLLWGATYTYRYAAEEREKNFVRETFGRYVSSDVMEELLDDPGKLTLDVGERREITVLFADINGFTTVSETRSPEEVIRMLNAYFAEMTAIIFKHKGTIGKFVGDELMVIYDAPRKHENPEQGGGAHRARHDRAARGTGQAGPPTPTTLPLPGASTASRSASTRVGSSWATSGPPSAWISPSSATR